MIQNCSLGPPILALLPQLHLIPNHALKNASHTPCFLLHRQDPFPHTSLSIPCKTLKGENSSAGLESRIRDSFLWSSGAGNTSLHQEKYLCSVDVQNQITSALCEHSCHSHWGTAMASLPTVAPGLHLCTPAVILSTALHRERMPTGC